MLSFDDLFGTIAPHRCLGCGDEGSVVCDTCIEFAGEPVVPRCAGCHKLSAGYRTCKSCRSWLEPYAVIVTTSYEGIYKQLIKSLKFEVNRQSASSIAKLMAELLPANDGYVLCPLPTAPARIRSRGFDHTKLITKYLAGYSGLEKRNYLRRKSNVRQLGSTRSQRLEQMENEFFVKSGLQVMDKNILLVDDVVTTGASLAAAAKVLKRAGAKRVSAIVFAQKI